MKNKNRRWIFTWLLLFPLCGKLQCEEVEYHHNATNANSTSKESRGVFSPRMDYEQWKPLGRGDPLKNDPTYDYVPPVLERVHYWIDPALRKPDPPIPGENLKKEILVLGVSSKKPSTGLIAADSRRDNYDPFMKFVEGPNFSNQKVSRPTFTIPLNYYSNFGNNKAKFNKESPVPSMDLMPPPIPLKSEENSDDQNGIWDTTLTSAATTTVETTPSVTIQEANLVYHSSSSVDSLQYPTIAEASSSVTWKTQALTSPIFSHKPLKDNEENKIREEFNEKPLEAPEAFMKEFSAPHSEVHTTSEHSNYVTVKPAFKKEKFVNHHSLPHKSSLHPMKTSPMPFMMFTKNPNRIVISDYSRPNMLMHHHMHHHRHQYHQPSSPMTLQSLQTKPPMMSTTKLENIYTKHPGPLHNILKGELSSSSLSASASPFSSHHPPLVSSYDPPTSSSSLPYLTSFSSVTNLLSPSETKLTPSIIATTEIPSTTTTMTSLTTDPLFKHYKQPMEPIRGPMYLIIQGHSRVKTYGPTKQLHGIPVQETNEISATDEKDAKYQVRHLHYNERPILDDTIREGRSKRIPPYLQTLTHVVQTGLGSIDFDDTKNRRNDDVKETEFVLSYDVAAKPEITSPKYYKGIVEAGDISRKLKYDP